MKVLSGIILVLYGTTYFLWTTAATTTTTTDVKITTNNTNNSLGRDISREYCLSIGPVYSKIFLNLNYTLGGINHFMSFISFASKVYRIMSC